LVIDYWLLVILSNFIVLKILPKGIKPMEKEKGKTNKPQA